MEEEWIQRAQRRDTEFVWASLDDRGRHIGFTGLHRIDWRNREATSGIVIGDKEAWGRREGVLRKRMWVEGRWHDTIAYAILDEDYFAERDKG